MSTKHATTSLSSQIGMVLLAIFPIFVICYLSYQISDDILSQEIKQALTLFAQKKVQAIDNFIHERTLDTYQISRLPSVKLLLSDKSLFEKHKVKNFFKNFLRESNFDNMYLINENKKVVYASKRGIKEGTNITELQGNKAIFSQLFNFSTTLLSPAVSFGEHYQPGLNTIFFTSPVFDKDLFEGVLILTLNHNALNKELHQNISLSESNKYIGADIGKKTNIIFSSDKNALSKKNMLNPLYQHLREAANGENGFALMKNPEGRQSLLVYRYVPEINMGLVMEYDAKTIYKKSVWLKKRIIFLFAVSILLILILTSWLLSRMKRVEHRNLALQNQILPYRILSKLKQNKHYQPEKIKNTPLVIISIDNLLKLSSLKPVENITYYLKRLNKEFNLLFSLYEVDNIAQRDGCYYLLLDKQDGKVNHAVNFSLALLDVVNHFNIDNDTHFDIKISITTGNLMMALLDNKKMQFHIWGEGFKRAQAILAHCPQKAIITSEATLHQLDNQENYQIKECGEGHIDDNPVKLYAIYIPERDKTS